MKTLATNPDIPVRAVQDQMQKQFDVGARLLGSLKQGFKVWGREILGLDGCFMLGPWPGQIQTTVGVDENNGIYPVAYAIVKADCKASWCWFLNLLGEDLAIAFVFPSVEHRYYVRHIHENMKSQFKGCVYKEMLWNAAKATSVGEINKKMGELKPPKKRKTSHDEITSQICSPSKLSRKGRSVKCSKCGNLGHNKKGCRGQGGASQVGGSSQAGTREAVGSMNVSGQAAGSRNASS
ncbi:mutator type transposase [Tanacetum coccineum]